MSLEEVRACPICQKEFVQPLRRGTLRKACSKACSQKLRTQSIRRGRNFTKCAFCGEDTGSYQRRYCPEHTGRTRKKGSALVEHTCLGCGESFYRNKSYPGKKRYCSNECSHRERRKVRDKYVLTLGDECLIIRSGYELRFIAVCMRFGLEWKTYDGPDIGEFEDGVYRPDFIVNGHVVEVKGRVTDRAHERIAAAAFPVLLITQADLLMLEKGDLSLLER